MADGNEPLPPPLQGRTIGITADRRWEEQAALFSKRGAKIVHGPTLRTVDLSQDEALRSVTADLLAAPPDYLVATTGMGMRMWLEAAQGWGQREGLVGALGQGRIIARGAKSASAIRNAGLKVWWQAPAERMNDIVERLRTEPLKSSERVALQLFDPDDPSTAALRSLTADLVEVPVYQWTLPFDLEPAERLIEAVINRGIDAVTFTAQPAVRRLFRIAERIGRANDLRAALNGPVLAVCVGPVCAEALVAEGVSTTVWPEPPRLPAMVRLVADRFVADRPGVGSPGVASARNREGPADPPVP